MDRHHKEFEEGLASLAEGQPAPAAERHVATCPGCAAYLAELRRVVDAARLTQSGAPADLVARAKSLMASSSRRLIARLLGSSLAAAGARAAKTEEFSLHLGAEDVSIRLLYTQTKTGWEIAGRAPSEAWFVDYQDERTPCGTAGRFRLTVPNLEDAGFLLLGPDFEIAVPPAAELIGRDS